jgi:hypothetical protein
MLLKLHDEVYIGFVMVSFIVDTTVTWYSSVVPPNNVVAVAPDSMVQYL